MATNIVGDIANILSGKRSFRVTDEITGATMLTDIGVKTVSMKFSSRLMQNVGENGLPIIDARVIMPTQISVSIVCNSADKVAEINSLLMNLTSTFTIMTRGIQLSNFMLDIESMTQSAAMLSSTPMEINFKQALLQGGGAPVCSQAGDASIIIGGIKKSVTVAADKVSDLSGRLLKSASQFFG